MITPPSVKVSEQEYLAFERANGWKHEFFRGVITAMPAVNAGHVEIVSNTAISLG